MMRYYDKLPDMECLAGDASPVFNVEVETEYDLSECTMYVVLAKATDPTVSLISKECQYSTSEAYPDGLFQAQLTSSETAALSEGMYCIYFSLHTPDDLKQKKLYGNIYIKASARE